jgi:hypothetical protein
MRANRARHFKAPRLLKETERTRQSESDDDGPDWSELKEKVVSERQGSDSEGDDIPFSQMTASKSTKEDSGCTGDGASVATTTEQMDDTNTEQVINPESMKGRKIARDFGGKAGVFYGEVVLVEYDSEDEGKVKSIPPPLPTIVAKLSPTLT